MPRSGYLPRSSGGGGGGGASYDGASYGGASYDGEATKATGSNDPSKPSSKSTGLKDVSLDHEKLSRHLSSRDRRWEMKSEERQPGSGTHPSASKQSELFQDSDEEDTDEEDIDEEDVDEEDMPISNLARMQNQASRASHGLRHHPEVKPAEPNPRRSRRPNLQTLEHDRQALRLELHQQSFLALSNEARSAYSLDETEIARRLAYGPDWLDGVQAASAVYEARQSRSWMNLIEKVPGITSQLLENLINMVYICRNIARIIEENVLRLADAMLVGRFMSILILDHNRSNDAYQVAILKEIDTSDLKRFLNSVLMKTNGLFEKVNDLQDTWIAINYLVPHSLHEIRSLLSTLGFPNLDTAFVAEPNKNVLEEANDRIWFLKCVLEILDIGLLVYEGAHCGSLVTAFFQKRQETAEDGQKITKARYGDLPPAGSFPIQLCRLRLKCLHAFLGRRDVWVFKHMSASLSKKPLYISTDIETFADVWGPVWKVTDKTSPASVRRYNVGGGSIFASTFDSSIHPPLREGERLCHWNDQHTNVRFENSSTPDDSETSDEDKMQFQLALTEPELLKEYESLLIGAHPNPGFGSNPGFGWRRCHCDRDALMQQLNEAGRLDRIIASKAYRFVDSQQASLILGSHGIQAGFGRTTKYKKEEPLKKSFLEDWENDPLVRDPQELENNWGVAVSLCTMNARRVRLSQLLGEGSVVSLLKPFRWSDLSWDGYRMEHISLRRDKFLEAVSSGDPCALRNLWDANPTWQEELGNVLLILLRILFKTGYDENLDEFHILWVPQGCRSPRRITLKPTDQTWIKFLRDTTYSMTVAVIVEEKLGHGRCCTEFESRWFEIPSALETAICVNESLNSISKLRKKSGRVDKYHWRWRESPRLWRSIWDVSKVPGGERFWTGPQSQLKVIAPLTRWHLQLTWGSCMGDRIRDMLWKRPSKQLIHREFTDQEESKQARPIPVHIVTVSSPSLGHMAYDFVDAF